MIATLGTSHTVIVTAALAWVGADVADRDVELVLTTDANELSEYQARAILRILHPNQLATTIQIERL